MPRLIFLPHEEICPEGAVAIRTGWFIRNKICKRFAELVLTVPPDKRLALHRRLGGLSRVAYRTLRDYFGLYDIYNQMSETGQGRGGQAAPVIDMSTPAEQQPVKETREQPHSFITIPHAFIRAGKTKKSFSCRNNYLLSQKRE